MGSTIRADLAPITDLAADLRGRLLEHMLGEASFAFKKQALHIGEKVTGGDRRLSRFGGGKRKGRTRLGVNYQLSGTRSVIEMKPAAMWALTTGGARAHIIGTGRRGRTGRYTKRRRRGVLKFPAAAGGSMYRTGPVRHPGSRGRSSLDRVHAQLPRIIEETFSEVMQEAIG